MPSTLNHELLAGMIKAKRGNKGLRITAKEIGNVSSATLSRVEKGKVPDVDTFIALCKWLDVPSDTFILGSETGQPELSNYDRIVAHLRADRELDANTINSLIRMIDLAYKEK